MNKFELYGQIVWLWSNSKLHKNWPISSAANYIIPAIDKEQFVLLRDNNGMPRGYVSWAFLSLDEEKKYILNPTSLQYKDWKSGNRLWFIDFIAPFSFNDTISLRRLMSKVHGDNYFGRSIRLRKDGTARIVEYSAGSKDKIKSQYLKNQFYEDIVENLNLRDNKE